jgi:hypothetical protein
MPITYFIQYCRSNWKEHAEKGALTGSPKNNKISTQRNEMFSKVSENIRF